MLLYENYLFFFCQRMLLYKNYHFFFFFFSLLLYETLLYMTLHLPLNVSCILMSCVPWTVVVVVTTSSLVSSSKDIASVSSLVGTLAASRLKRCDVTEFDVSWRLCRTCWSKSLASTRSAQKPLAARHAAICWRTIRYRQRIIPYYNRHLGQAKCQ